MDETEATKCLVGTAYEWYGGDNTVTWYELYINRNNSLFAHQWFSAADVSTILWDGTCRTRSISGHTDGNYTWWVRCWSPITGYSAWSPSESFTLY